MNYIVLDLEWNQPRSYAETVMDPVMLTGEIVQIGAVKLDEAFQPVDSFDRRVKPCCYCEIHPRVAAVTRLTTADLRRGDSFRSAFEAFSHWCGSDCCYIVWGTEDMRILRKNLLLHDMETAELPQHYNLQNIFAVQKAGEIRQYALKKALAMVREKPYAAHDAWNDAMSTALLCKHLDMDKGLQEYRELIEKRSGIVETCEFEELYYDADDVLSDDYVISFECPDCGELIWCDDWVNNTGRQLLSVAQCEDGKEFLVKLKLSYTLDERIRVKRIVYEMTEENRLYYNNCAESEAAWKRYVVPACAV